MTIRMVVSEKGANKEGDYTYIIDAIESKLTPKGNLSRYFVLDLLRHLSAGRNVELRQCKPTAPGLQLTDAVEPGADLAPLEIYHSSNCATRTGADCDCEER